MGVCDGLSVIDFSSWMAGPLATMVLADNGADVIKVEPPEGDPARDLPAFQTWNRGKKSIVRRVNISMRGQVCAGDDMIITGHVTKKYREGDEGRVDVEVSISTQDGPVTPSSATVALPSRSEAK